MFKLNDQVLMIENPFKYCNSDYAVKTVDRISENCTYELISRLLYYFYYAEDRVNDEIDNQISDIMKDTWLEVENEL